MLSLRSVIAKMLVTVAIIIAAAPAFSAPLIEQWTSVRALGMGNAYTAVVSDSDALFYNPAALCRIKGFNWTVFDPRVGLDGLNSVTTVTDFSKAKGSSASLSQYLDTLYGHHYWAGGGAKTAFTLPCFGAGAFSDADLTMYMTNPAYPTLDVNYFADYGFTMGGAVPLDPAGLSSMGLVARRVTRVGTSSLISASSLSGLDYNTIYDQMKNRGSGYALDVGLNFSIPTPIKPTFSVVYKNLGYTTFKYEGGPGAPARIDPDLVLGASLSLETPLITITPAVDYAYVTQADEQIGKKIHLGVEISTPLLDLRAGLNQGYYTAGAGLNLGILRVDAVTYGEELGVYPGQQEDRRYMLQVTLDLGLDLARLSGKSSSEDGAPRSHLIQRR